jgi:outer membrane protein OmpA-like peptidoglycan-associated protein
MALRTEKVKREVVPVPNTEAQIARENEQLAQFLSEHVISFRTNTAQIDENGRQVLDDVYEMLKSQNNVHVLIIGHTDASGNEAYNRDLSLRRAQAVAHYLRQKGWTNATFETIGMGSAEPIAENDSRQGRKKNRRVEIKIKGE